MNKLALSALMIGGLLQTAGCIITTDDGGSAASFDVAWGTAECPAGASAEVISQNQANSERFTDIYNCTDGVGITDPLALGTYDVWVEFVVEGQLYAQSNAVTSTLSADGQIAAVNIPDFPVNEGFFGLTWNLVDTQGTALTCEEVFADGVSVLATHADTNTSTDDIFNCNDYEGVTSPVLVGTHTLLVDILQGNESLGSSLTREETVTFGNELVDLGNFEFIFSAAR